MASKAQAPKATKSGWARRLAAFGWVLCLFLGTATSVAEPADAPHSEQVRRDRARELFTRGAELATEERYQEALAAFEQSARLFPHASTSYNIAFSERALGRVTRARKHLRDAIARDARHAGKELTPEQRAASEQLLAELEQRVARVRITLEPATLRLAVDGRPLETGERGVMLAGTREPGDPETPSTGSFEVLLDPGAHVFSLADQHGHRQFVEERFASGENGPIVLTLDTERALLDRGAPQPPYWQGRRIGAVALGGVGLAGLAVGVGLAVSAGSLWSDAQEACPTESRCPDDRGQELSSEALQHGNLATAAFVVGGAALAGSALLWLTAPPAEEGDVAVATDGRSLRLTGRF